MNAKNRILKMLVVIMGIVLLAQAVPAGADEMVTLGYDQEVNVRYTFSNRSTVYKGGLRVGLFFTNYYYRSYFSFDLSNLIASDYSTTGSTVESLTLRASVSGDRSIVTVYAIDDDWQYTGDPNTDTPCADLWNGGYGAPVGTYDAVAGGWVFSGGDMTALINRWINGNNAGFVFIGDEAPDGAAGVTITAGSEALDVVYSVPEPATMAMLGLGGVMMLVRRRRTVA